MNVEPHPAINVQPLAVEPFLEAEEVAPFLKMSPRHLKKLAREGRVPAHPRGEGQRRRWLFLLSELDQWMRAKVNCSHGSFREARSIQ